MLRLQLIQENGVVLSIRDVSAEVVHSSDIDVRICLAYTIGCYSPPVPSGSLQMVIEPTQQDLIRCQPQQVFNRLSFLA